MRIAQAGPQITRLELMPVFPAVLCYGHHNVLLYTRQRILEDLGCCTETVSNAAEYWAYLLRKTPRVIVLCQTLSADESDDAISFAADHWPGSRLLMMYVQTRPDIRRNCSSLASQDGPKAFGQAVSNLLRDWSNESRLASAKDFSSRPYFPVPENNL